VKSYFLYNTAFDAVKRVVYDEGFPVKIPDDGLYFADL
jgi:hypothetical protein